MASKQTIPNLPPGVKLESTYIPYQQGQIYTQPKVEESKKQGKKQSKTYGWEDDDTPEKIQKVNTGLHGKGFSINKEKSNTAAPSADAPQKEPISSFTFINQSVAATSLPAPSAVSPATKQENGSSLSFNSKPDIMMKEAPGMLETKVMGDYLQPGGATTKMSKEEKDQFLFKMKNMNKKIIASCIINCFKVTEEPSIVGKAITCMEALLESSENASEYKKIFVKEGLNKLEELSEGEKMKSINKRIQGGIAAIKGEKKTKVEEPLNPPVASASKSTLLPNIATTKPLNILEDIPFTEATKPTNISPASEEKKTQKESSPASSQGLAGAKKKKANAFELMKELEKPTTEKAQGVTQSTSSAEKTEDIFANMDIKTNSKQQIPSIPDLLNPEKVVLHQEVVGSSAKPNTEVSSFNFIAIQSTTKSVEPPKPKVQSLYELQKNLKSMYEAPQEYPVMPPPHDIFGGPGQQKRNVYYMPTNPPMGPNSNDYSRTSEIYDNAMMSAPGVGNRMQAMSMKPEIKKAPAEPDKYFGFVDKELEQEI